MDLKHASPQLCIELLLTQSIYISYYVFDEFSSCLALYDYVIKKKNMNLSKKPERNSFTVDIKKPGALIKPDGRTLSSSNSYQALNPIFGMACLPKLI